jgi:hypothetical protein
MNADGTRAEIRVRRVWVRLVNFYYSWVLIAYSHSDDWLYNIFFFKDVAHLIMSLLTLFLAVLWLGSERVIPPEVVTPETVLEFHLTLGKQPVL